MSFTGRGWAACLHLSVIALPRKPSATRAKGEWHPNCVGNSIRAMPPGFGGGHGIAGERDDQGRRGHGPDPGPEGEPQPLPQPDPQEVSDGRLRKGLAWATAIGLVCWLVVILLVIELRDGRC